MTRPITLFLLAGLLLSGCNAAAMQGFSRGLERGMVTGSNVGNAWLGRSGTAVPYPNQYPTYTVQPTAVPSYNVYRAPQSCWVTANVMSCN